MFGVDSNPIQIEACDRAGDWTVAGVTDNLAFNFGEDKVVAGSDATTKMFID